MATARRMDANLVVVLDAILTERNLTRAGDRIGLTQPAMSGVLRRLRAQLDDPLLVRVGRHFELTPRAISLIPVVTETIAALAETLEPRPDFISETSERRFLISASDYALSVLTAPLYQFCEQTAPSISIEFDSLPSESAVTTNDLLRRDLYIASSGRGVPGRRQDVFTDEFVVVVDRRNPRLAQDGSLTLDALAGMDYVAGVFGQTHPTPADDMLAQHGLSPPVATTVRGLLAVPYMVAGTEMFGIVPRRVAQAQAAEIGIVVAATPLAPAALIETAHWHPTNSTDRGLLWLLGVLRSVGRQLG